MHCSLSIVHSPQSPILSRLPTTSKILEIPPDVFAFPNRTRIERIERIKTDKKPKIEKKSVLIRSIRQIRVLFFWESQEFHNRWGSGTILLVMTKPLARSQPTTTAPLSRWDGILAFVLGLMALTLYFRTLAPGLLDGDAGEFQFAAWGFGLAHPTGYPLYLLLGGVWQHGLALFGADPAWALNLFSAVTAALTVALLFLTMRKIIPGPAGVSRGVALFSAALFAVNPTFWSQALIAEVYALHGLLMGLILLAALTWDGSMRRTVMLAGLVGLGLAHHRTTVFVIPGVLLAVWLIYTGLGQPAGSRTRLERVEMGRWRLWIGAGAAVVLPQLLYLYIPLRGTPEASPWYFPRLGEAAIPLYTNSFQGFLDYLTGSVFAVSFFGLGQALARLPEAGMLWLDHFTWAGVGLIGLGLIVLSAGSALGAVGPHPTFWGDAASF